MSLRQTGLLATRLALAHRPASRAFTISLTRHSDDSKSNSSSTRVNPLIGNTYNPPAPKAAFTNDDPIPQIRSALNANAASPPPPPPPPPAATETSKDSVEEDGSGAFEAPFAYDATKPTPTAAEGDASPGPAPFDIASILASKYSTYMGNQMTDPLQRPKFRTAAVTGRTVFIRDRISATTAPTPTVALRVLDRLTKDQKIRNKYHSQKFHERPGLRRKRLKGERWRSRFKIGFKAAVSRVLELKRQGW